MPGGMILEAKMMGGFSMSYNGKGIVLDRNVLSKTTQLLQILLLHHREGISKASLLDALYGRDDVENKNGSLNNTIFRMRKQLKAAGLPESSYITIKGGMCYWDTAIPVRVDALSFEEKVKEGRLEADPDRQIALFREACKLYTGEFLPNMIGEDWASVRNVRYRDSYTYCVSEACHALMARERYEEVLQIAHSAAEIYPFEDWQIWEIDSLIALTRYKEAMEVYERTTRLLMDELGLTPSPEMLKRFRIMGERMAQAAGAIEDIKQRLREKDEIQGAYFCTYPSFVDIYHVFSRIMERKGISVYIMLCTLKNSKNQVCGEREGRDREASGQLGDAIRLSLRRGDFYTRYNHSQYLVMLSEITRENCGIVSDRIARKFRTMELGGSYRVDFYVASIAEVQPRSAALPEKKFKKSGSLWKKHG